ncbi:lytic murein transglycosylase [Aliiroseovarius subalbicans]|uniref:lytic murein transglycosylase n=1 Tax=Aliiroseovarius subalbicans TaxID=2925840 RepID=UPI001F55D777|nr:lytic murein transglycosylase [Aliiroseovarius subalbicans]MCI2397864.1 lytic murein transglycosylase [Aliiroseovarius subalbicans]
MVMTRRELVAGLSALGVVGCDTGGVAPAVPKPPRPADPPLAAAPNAGFDAWVAGFKGRARARGLSGATLTRAFANAGYLPGVVTRDRSQFQTRRTLEDYLAISASDDRVATGRAAMRRHAATLSQIEARYGVEAKVLGAIWGMESRYGARRGNTPVVSALATLAYAGRRGAFFESQLIAALKILERGDITPERMTGSWAGAMGHTQFIPTTYQAYAVDFDGDGRRDVWGADPTDALASAAHYLKKSGWRTGRPWGLEVRLPNGFSAATGRSNRRNVAAWHALGLRDMDGGRLPDHGAAAVLRLAGATGPAFLVFHNFDVLLRYNNTQKYGLAVGHLSDRLAGGGPVRGEFGVDANGMTLVQRKELQRRLSAKGFDAGDPDGVIGKATIAAIRAYQAAKGMAVDGTPTLALLRHLGG